ncbi:hypothetical protein PG993_002416 [Apiospora rasikravindrae]|uniref:Uncharacterized protein n=1 Tax=Apiospora rasikravindrae TaxID=990691 RepID=A0ABR1TWK4_9PEZI
MSSHQEQHPSHIDTTSDHAPVKVPATPVSPQLEKDAARAMKGAESWKPSFARQQSFSKEEQKHTLQMTGLGGSSDKSGHGFTEK